MVDIQLILVFLGCAAVAWFIFQFFNKSQDDASVDFSQLELDSEHREPSPSVHSLSSSRPKTFDEPSVEQPIVALTVLAGDPQGFRPDLLCSVLEELDLSLHDKGFYHCHYNADPSQIILYTVTSLMEPGTFFDEDGQYGEVPGVMLFMGGFNGEYSLETFERMLMTAQHVASVCGGTLCDGRRKTLSNDKLNALKRTIEQLEKVA